MLGIFLAIVSAIFMAAMQILLKKSYKELDPSVAYFFDMIFGLIVWIPIGFIFGATLNDIWKCLPYAVISAIFSEALVFYALSKGNLSVASVLTATYPVYTLIFSVLLNNERLSILQIILILVTIIGTVLTSLDNDFKAKNLKSLTIIIPIITAIAIGLSDTLTKGIIDETSAFNFLVAIAIVQLPVSIAYLIISKQKLKKVVKELKKGVKSYKYSIIGSLFNVIRNGMFIGII